jgi:hypothetical protein
MFRIIKNKAKHLCQAYRCKSNRGGRDRFCSKHRKRYQKYTNPRRYTYNYLKNNAKRRGKFFDLTFEEFVLFCDETGYMDCKGRTKNCGSIDRIDPDKGYTYSNIQLLTVSENSSKQHSDNSDECDDVPF